jgi:hypothetical protein
MSSYNKVMQMHHAYKREGKIRIHLGYYLTKQDADEAEKLGEKTAKAWTKNKRAERLSEKVITRLAGNRDDRVDEDAPTTGYDRSTIDQPGTHDAS